MENGEIFESRQDPRPCSQCPSREFPELLNSILKSPYAWAFFDGERIGGRGDGVEDGYLGNWDKIAADFEVHACVLAYSCPPTRGLPERLAELPYRNDNA